MSTGGEERGTTAGAAPDALPLGRAFVQAAPVGIALFDLELRFVFANAYLAQINGVAAEDLIGKRIGDISERFGEAVERILTDARDRDMPSIDVELSDDGPGGSGKAYRASHFPVRVDGELVAIGATIIDVTDARRALAHEQAARAIAEQAAGRSERLRALGASLASTATTEEVAEVAVHGFARYEAQRVTMVRTMPAGLEAVGAHGVDPDFAVWIQDVDLRQSSWAAPVLDGHPVWVPDRDELLREHPGAQVAQTDTTSASWCLLPLSSNRGVMGVLALHWNEPQPFDEAQRSFLSLAAELIGSALARAATHEELQRAHDRLRAAYDQRDRVARTLRAGLSPRSVQLPPPLDLGAVLRLGSADQVGGDFYDGVRSADGSWIVSVGDVCGKGAEAAALTALVRYAIRATAMSTSDPVAILRTVNRALLAEDTGLFCALTLLRVEPDDDGTDVVVTLAGQHQVRVCRADGSVELTGTFGSLVGVSHDLVLDPVPRRLAPGDALLAFTDGLVERSHSFDEPELDELLRSLARAGASQRPSGLVDEVVRAAYALPADRSDDVCVVAIGHGRAPS